MRLIGEELSLGSMGQIKWDTGVSKPLTGARRKKLQAPGSEPVSGFLPPALVWCQTGRSHVVHEWSESRGHRHGAASLALETLTPTRLLVSPAQGQ